MKKSLLLFVLLMGCLHADVNWAMNFESAKAIAKESKKPIMIQVSAQGCPPCKYMLNTVLKNKKVEALLNEKFVPVLYKLPHDTLPSEIRTKVRGTPTIFFYKEGKEVYKVAGPRPPKQFLGILEKVVQY